MHFPLDILHLMNIVLKEVKARKDLGKFIYYPASNHKNHDAWIPSIYPDDWKFFDPRKNKSFSYSDTVLLLAIKNGKTVGRIMGLINKRYNEIHKENHARFAFMECEDHAEIAHSLLQYVENWARQKGMEKIIGPMGFSDKDPQGFLIEGFEHRAVLETACNHPYMVELIENEGYEKKVDLNDYLIKVPDKMPELYTRIYSRLINNGEFKLVEFKSTKELKRFIIPVLQLMNETYGKIYGYVPLSEKEMQEYAKRYLPILDPDFCKVVTKDEKVIGFVIAMPDLGEGLKKAKGRLYPFGIFKILISMKRTKHLVLLLGAIQSQFRGMGTDALMAVKILETAMKRGMTTIESHLILETNTKMTAEVIKAGGKEFKKFRIYSKAL